MPGDWRTISVALVLEGQQFDAKLSASAAGLQRFEQQAVRSGKGAAAGLDETSKSTEKMGSTVKGTLADAEGRFGSFGKTVAGALVTIGAVQFGRSIVREGEEARKGVAQTEAVLRSTGGAAHVTAGDVDDLSKSLSEKVGVDDDLIRSGANVLLTFRDIRNEAGAGNDIFNQTVAITEDMSVALGEDLKSSSIQVGKALQDPILGLTALRRVGVGFTAQQKDQIRTLTESGDKLGAQKIILAELTKEFGGSAEAQGTDLAKAGASWKNFEEDVGTALAPGVDAIARFGGAGAHVFGEMPGWAQTALSSTVLIGGAFAFLAPKASKAWGALSDGAGALKGLMTTSNLSSTALTGLGLAVAAVGTYELAKWGDSMVKDLKVTDDGVVKLNSDMDHLIATGEVAPDMSKALSQIIALRKGADDPMGGSLKIGINQITQALKPMTDEIDAQVKTSLPKAKDAYAQLRGEWIAGGGSAKDFDRATAVTKAKIDSQTQSLKDAAAKAHDLATAMPELGRAITAGMDSKAIKTATDDLHKYEDSVRSALSSATDAISGTASLIGPDVAAKRLTDVATAQDKVAQATSAQADAQAKLLANPTPTADDLKSLATANDNLATARTDLSTALQTANTSDVDSIMRWYGTTLTTTQQFSDNINKAILEGYDPGLISQILQEGPAKAAPFLAAIVSDQGQQYETQINQAQQAIGKMQAQIIEQSRLTYIATHAKTDAQAKELPQASALDFQVQLHPEFDDVALAAVLGTTKENVDKWAADFGIQLPAPTVGPVPPVVLGVDDHQVKTALDQADLGFAGYIASDPTAYMGLHDEDVNVRLTAARAAFDRYSALHPEAVAGLNNLPAMQRMDATNQILQSYVAQPLDFSTGIDWQTATTTERVINGLARDREAKIYVRTIADAKTLLGGFGLQINRHGGVLAPDGMGGMVRTFAGGGMHVPQVGNGSLRIWDEPATGGEAYIPQRGDRGRAWATMSTAARWYGFGMTDPKALRFADGGTLTPGAWATSTRPPPVPPSFRSVSSGGGGGTFVDQSTIQVIVPNLPAGATLRDVERVVEVALDKRDRTQLARSRR